MKLIHISEGVRMFKRALYVHDHGFRKYDGKANKICKQIVTNCWNGDYFQTSAGHFCEFYMRDFAFCIEALLKLGYQDEVLKTLNYALEKFSKHGRVTTSISPKGKCFDFPNYAEDSLPLLIRSLRTAKAKTLIKKYNSFLKREIEYYYGTIFDSKLGLIRSDRSFSSIKDYAKRRSSTYGNSMLVMLKDDLGALKLFNPFRKYNIRQNMMDELWSGEFFYDDIQKTSVFSSDANVFPFWCGAFDDKKMFLSCAKQIKKLKLDMPFPLKYMQKGAEVKHLKLPELFSGDYERDSVWMHLGLCYLDVCKKYKHPSFKIYKSKYLKTIEKYGNFLEVFNSFGKPFNTPFYFTDDSMLWASKFLVI
ncbi:hypothetical protein HN419_02280 [Candidatus Woesearchaeota archaeon]|nr:hypothetical protein [Candidatus Woesearchaeota archaeon]MBT3537176.1 hypothetical protein [Candidatus Woesearchaeota archaeon]MBT4696678.1 hypothetical protein [Candidatus Woesearchaeota archaeon]MBT7106514.1 hypothetical protein [Candidatus Woesearchaeota archaeon]MBT7931111.1 hypothetical protein [Candidatus Woesearchaeota archaeon]